ncbi:hypothetical protein DM02DRAFT_618381 [Periconia macrospinosa]|uniref:C2H2-type domain-containing protein n=1 Tax=Periconia macrospinosa TaxID=97972 RepID=A0A2V1D9P3_9PLEO|nr:hypothetical protein DM02DRAFT_618381 [Periconia macrospinosa]
MTKKKKKYLSITEKLKRPWCYYCERDFDDLKILISHQKAKHFKCDRCGRRLNTAGGLSVHMNQVHKETLTQVENALAGRQGLDVEIFGMEGVPESAIKNHDDLVTEKHYADEAERMRLSGNTVRGTLGAKAGVKRKLKIREEEDDADEHAAKWRTDRRNGVPRPVIVEVKAVSPPPQQPTPTVAAPQPAQPIPPPGAVVPPFPPNGAPGFPPPPGLPNHPPFPPGQFPPPGALPTRPGFSPPQPNPFPPASNLPQQIDDLIASTAAAAAAAETAQEKDRRTKKGREAKLLFFDEDVSPEEKTAMLPRYRRFVRT